MPKNNLQKILQSINEKLALHGGGVSLVELNEQKKTISLKLQGACSGCPMAQITTENFIKKELMARMPELKEIKIVN